MPINYYEKIGKDVWFDIQFATIATGHRTFFQLLHELFMFKRKKRLTLTSNLCLALVYCSSAPKNFPYLHSYASSNPLYCPLKSSNCYDFWTDRTDSLEASALSSQTDFQSLNYCGFLIYSGDFFCSTASFLVIHSSPCEDY